MKLWLISQDENNNYDTYDSAVVAAETESDAQRTNPGEYACAVDGGLWAFDYRPAPCQDETWANWDKVKVRLIGDAIEGTPPSVICASFNAG